MAVKGRIAVVGLGSIGTRHARLLCERSDVCVELVEPNIERLAMVRDKLGDLPNYQSFEDMLETTPDMVLIATPHEMHASQVVQALEADIHVLCEKPMSDNLADAIKMKEAANRSSGILNIGFQLHFHPGLRRLKEIIDQGILGSVLHAHARVGTYVTLVNSVSRHQAKKEGSLFLDYAHQPDMFYWLLREKPVSVYTSAFEAGNLELLSNPNIAAVNCEYKAPLLSSIHLNYVQMPMRHEYEIVGDKGWTVLDMISGLLRIGTREDSKVRTETFVVERDDIFRQEHQAFMDTVKGIREPETSASDGLVSMSICEAIIESWKRHEPVKVQL